MKTLTEGYRGLSLLVDLNWDLALYFGTLSLALLAATYLGTQAL
ncbi:hypothetical protein AB1M95_07370 [Sulfitobacter sp. LCG007]